MKIESKFNIGESIFRIGILHTEFNSCPCCGSVQWEHEWGIEDVYTIVSILFEEHLITYTLENKNVSLEVEEDEINKDRWFSSTEEATIALKKKNKEFETQKAKSNEVNDENNEMS